MKGISFNVCCFAALAVALTLSTPKAAAQVAFDGAWYYGGPGDQSGLAITASPDGVFIGGYNHDQNSIALKYPLAPATGSSPEWAVAWPFANAAPKHEAFLGVSPTSEGVYFAGWSYSQTSDAIGDKEGKSVLVKFPLTGPTGPATGGADWVAKPMYFPSYQGYELFIASTSTTEGGAPFVYAAGCAQTNGANLSTTLSKFDAGGAMVWSRILSGGGFGQYSQGLGLTNLDGSLYVAGYMQNGGAVSDATLWRYDESGNALWMRSYHLPGSDGRAWAVAASGRYIYVVGSVTNGPHGGDDAIILKYDRDGSLLWSKTWGGSADDIANGVTVIGDRVFVDGETASFGAGGKDVFLLEVDADSGNALSQTYYGGMEDDSARGIASYGDDLYLVGETRSFAVGGNRIGENDIVMLRYSFSPTAVPEPGPLALLIGAVAGGVGLAFRRRRGQR